MLMDVALPGSSAGGGGWRTHTPQEITEALDAALWMVAAAGVVWATCLCPSGPKPRRGPTEAGPGCWCQDLGFRWTALIPGHGAQALAAGALRIQFSSGDDGQQSPHEVQGRQTAGGPGTLTED